MKTRLLLCLAAGAALLAIARAQEPAIPDISYQKFVLKNGLTLLVHEDHKAPIVAVNVWYHVGSKNEKPGKTGFAHLFEHLMFNGSENFNDDYFKAMEKVGATDLNGTTSEDRTNYFQNVPRAALDFALWMESDRMGHLVNAITQAKLDEQRGVVQNEKRQGENQPYAIAEELITHNTWPAGHPYSWTVIGSMEDLNAASLEDVKEWFKTYYGAANATLVVAGDVTTEEARAKVEKYFGAIPSGPPVARHSVAIAKRTGIHRMVAEDRVPQSRLYQIWNVPQFGSTQANLLSLVADVLARGKNSRFYKRLVYDEQIATEVSASVNWSEIASQFTITADAKPGVDAAVVEKALDEELARFLASGPTAEELSRVKVQREAGLVRGMERIGGFGGKSDILAHNFVFTGNPVLFKTGLQEIRAATPKQLLDLAREWLSDGQFILTINPFPTYSSAPGGADRSKLPVPELKADARFPKFATATLSNGLKVVLAERHSVPVVDLTLLVNSGYAADTLARPGCARLAADMLDEGTAKRDALQISRELDSIGAQLSTGCNLDLVVVALNTLTTRLDPALNLYADVILHPAFPDSDFKRLQKQYVAGIQREKADPNTLALRILPGLIYGPKHPYGAPFTGSGNEESIAQLSPADLQRFHATWFKPNNATLIVVGDTTLAEITPKLEKMFSSWKPGAVPTIALAEVKPPTAPRVFILDRPGAQQSVIFVGQVAPPKANPEESAIEIMNDILGGAFTSRVNMNLREDKHWSYGVFSAVVDARGQRPFLALAPVQADKTKEALQELQREFSEFVGTKPPTEEERVKAVKDRTLGLAGTWETSAAVSGSLEEIVRFGLPDDYFAGYAGRIEALKQDEIAHAARTVVHPDALTWVIVGDRAKIEAGIRALNWGEVQLLDADGKILK